MRAVSGLLPTLILATLAFAQEESKEEGIVPLAGHSHHGEAYNEGPRQKAYLMGTTSDVHFPATTTSAKAQAFIDQGFGQLHGFWYLEAERSFRQAAAIDPNAAMAYWGMAFANFYNEPRAFEFAREAHRRRDKISEHERLYVDAIARYFDALKDRPENAEPLKVFGGGERRSDAGKRRARRFIEDLEGVVDRYPDDIEAKALLVNQMWLNQRHAGLSISSKAANQALLDQVFAKNPRHPAHHYQIHLWDSKSTAKRAVRAASRSGLSAPGIAHMWHMGGHIWWRLGRRADSAWSQEASARVDHAHMMRDRVLPDEIHNYAHNNEWLTRSLRSVGRVHDALDLAKNMVELPRHPKFNSFKKGGSARYGRDRLRELLDWFELWDETLRLEGTMYLEVGDDRGRRAQSRALFAMARYHKGQHDRLQGDVDAINELIAAERAARAGAADKAEWEALGAGKNDADVEKAISEAQRSFSKKIRTLRRSLDVVEGWNLLAKGETASALKKLKSGRLHKGHLARLQLAAGNKDEALKIATDWAKREDGAFALPHATLAWIQHACGKTEEAKKTFEKLRKQSARFAMDLPCHQRLAPLAKECGYPEDWRVAPETPDDVGRRVPLDSLGPFRWSPMKVPSEWTLPNGAGKQVSSSAYRGRPHLVVFFLGFDCLHCVEQLGALVPMAEAFEKTGIDIVTIGNCTEEQIAKSVDKSPFPFPILADPELKVFKKWRCFDDFEGLDLHGTFLIDEGGFVRWQDISYEPFMEVEWLLDESKRLLGLPVRPASAGGGSK